MTKKLPNSEQIEHRYQKLIKESDISQKSQDSYLHHACDISCKKVQERVDEGWVRKAAIEECVRLVESFQNDTIKDQSGLDVPCWSSVTLSYVIGRLEKLIYNPKR